MAMPYCARSAPASGLEDGFALQADIRRAEVGARSMGRFGLFALLEEGAANVPCEPPVSESQRECVAHVVGRGRVKLTLAGKALFDAGNVRRDAVVAVEYATDCANVKFDFKTLDQALPRKGSVGDAIHVWEDRLLTAKYERKGELPDATCTVLFTLAPPLLRRLSAKSPTSP
jgi:hypothetical protein